MEARSFTRVTDIAESAPNVVMKPANAAFGPAAQVFIRGVGQADSSFALEPGVGLYVDDVYRGVVFGSVLDLLDLDRVEILRGPQGTLAGKNSIGGAVKLYTQKPTGDGSGYIELTGGNLDRLDLKASGDFSLIEDKLFARVSGVTRHRDGYFTLYDFACTHPGTTVPTAASNANDCKLGTQGGQDYTAGRVALRWLATSDIEVNVVANRLEETSDQVPVKLIALNLVPAAAPTMQGANQAQFLTGPRDYSSYATNMILPFTDPAAFTGRPGAGSHGAVAMSPDVVLRSEDYSGTIDWNLSGSLALKSITGYQDIAGRYTNDVDTTPYTVNQSDFYNAHRQFTQELRLNGAAGPVDWTVGAYYYDATSFIKGVNYLQPGTATQNLNSPNDTITTQSQSGFAHAVWHVTDALDLTTGLRYTDDEKTYQYQRLNPYVAGIPTYTAAGVLTGARGSYQGDRWDYRVNVSYQWTTEVMTYAQFSTGYRGGGINPRPFVPEQAGPFDPETLDAYEIGIKSDFFDRRLRANLSVFLNEYQDIIFTNTAPTPTSFQNATPVNAGDADIKGAELELTARPVDGLLVDLAASYLDFEFTRIGAAGATITGVTLSNVAPFNPEWKVSAGLQYEIALGGAGTLTPRVDGSYQDSYYTAVDNNPLSFIEDYTLYNARLTWRSPEEEWQASLAVTNLEDKFYYTHKFRLPIGITTGQVAPPRQWSLSVRRNF
jgi:iron complex outermembrane receptor protein